MPAFASNLTVHDKRWTAWKIVQLAKSLNTQYDETDNSYSIWGYDGPEVHVCAIYKTSVPDFVLAAGYSQEQNDADKNDFETHFKSKANMPVDPPRATDGKPFVLPNIFPGDVILNFAGCSDAPGDRFGGDLLGLQQVGVGDGTHGVVINDGVYLAGGHVEWDGGSWGSYVYMELIAPASTTKTPAMANQGNCNRVPTGYGFDIIVPAAGNGAYDLDVVVPVPATTDETNIQNGYWNYSEPWIGKGVVAPGIPGASKYNLYTAQLELAHFVKMHLFKDSGSRDLIAPAIKPKWILPEWTLNVNIHNADANKTLRVSWDLLIARRKTT